jgi:predicted hydrocarbon binding protein
METFTDSNVEQHECMVRGGDICRFKLKSKAE